MRDRKRLRLEDYDYSLEGRYFLTLCVAHRVACFGRIQDGEVVLNRYGQIVQEQWEWLFSQYPHVIRDTYIIMPDHIHCILGIRHQWREGSRPFHTGYLIKTFDSMDHNIKPLPQIVGAFKTTTSKRIHQAGYDVFRWQKSYYERIIRDEQELVNVRQYIVNNPKTYGLLKA